MSLPTPSIEDRGGHMTVSHPVAQNVGPTPWTGDLELTIQCRTARDAMMVTRHTLVIHDDWSVTTPHDLEAERIASAFGGYASCVDLMDRVIPRLRDSLSRVARRARPALRRDKRRAWRVPTHEIVECCRNHTFQSVQTIAEHMRSPTHLANVLGLPLWQVDEIVRQVGQACRPDMGATSPNARYLREQEGLEDLWRAGIHPDHVPELAAYASAVDEPLPTTYFEGVVYAGYHPEWINGVLKYRPDADTAAWLAWQTPPDILSDAREWGLWLRYGLSRRDFAFAVDELVPADTVADVIEATGWPERTAARVVIGFAKADCRPTPEQLTTIARFGMEHTIPGKATVDVAVEDARRVGAPINRTELSLMLTIIGNRPTLLAAIQRGVWSVSDLGAIPGRW